MNHDPNMTDAERNLLGPQAADELAGDEQWLATRLDAADSASPMPADLTGRVLAAVRRKVELESARARGWRNPARWRVAAAAAILFVALVGTYWAMMLSNRPINPAVDSVAAAQRNVDAYVRQVDASMRTVDRVNASLTAADKSAGAVQREIAQLNKTVELAESAENPWTSVADAIEVAGR